MNVNSREMSPSHSWYGFWENLMYIWPDMASSNAAICVLYILLLLTIMQRFIWTPGLEEIRTMAMLYKPYSWVSLLQGRVSQI